MSPPAVEEENRPPFQFSLRALLIFTTYVAVLLSIGLMVPGLGILTAILLTPALLRTYFRSVQAAARGERLSGSEKAFNFIAGMAVALCIGVAWAVAIAVAAFAACLGSWNGRGQSAGLSAVLVLGGVIGLGFTIFLLWYFCIRPDRKE